MASDGLRVRVDQDLCSGDGLCVQYAPDVFEFDVDGLAYVKDGSGELQLAAGATVDVSAEQAAAVVDSAIECPGECIHVTDAEGRAVAGPDFVGMPQVPSRITA
jgi:ferredoxin